MIKAVIFDIDGVLLDSFEANLKFYQNLMTFSGHRPPTRQEFPPLFHLAMWDGIKKLTGLSKDEDIKKIWEMGKNRKSLYPVELLKMPDGIAPTVRTLNKKYLLGIVTSRVKKSVFESPELAAMQKYFQVTISYEDTLNHKPHPEPLLLAAKKLDTKPEETVYIGDVENDVRAAHAANMKAIIYSKNTQTNADRYTASFKSLPKLISTL
ncbi:MAG: HAD-IA family hydrolase [Patescibacteria group bacterium]|jgi:pyrophosphatase PpaX